MKLYWSFLQACIGVLTVWLLLLNAAEAVPFTLLQILMPAAGLGLVISICSAVDLSLAAFILFVRMVNRHDSKRQFEQARSQRLRRAVLMLCCLGLTCPAMAMEKPVLLIVHSDACQPCRVFDSVYSIDAELRTALHRAFDVRELDLGVPSQRLEAEKLGVSAVPTFLVLRNGKPVSTHCGFSNTMEVAAVNRAIADLMDDLQVEWPLPRVDPPKKSEPVTKPAPVPVPIAPTSHPGPTIDQVARDGITKLATQSKELREFQQKTQQQVEAISADVRQLRNEVTESNNGLRSQIESGSRESRTQLETISRTLQQSIESTRSSTREELQTIIRERIEAAQASKPTPHISTEMKPAPTASKWVSMVATLGKLALTVAAPEVAIPGSLALTAIGFGLRAMSRRRKSVSAAKVPERTETRIVPVAVDAPISPPKIQTETHFVPIDRDTHQQAHAWAKEQLARRYPGAAPTLETLDSLIAQFLEGRKD